MHNFGISLRVSLDWLPKDKHNCSRNGIKSVFIKLNRFSEFSFSSVLCIYKFASASTVAAVHQRVLMCIRSRCASTVASVHLRVRRALTGAGMHLEVRV